MKRKCLFLILKCKSPCENCEDPQLFNRK